MNSVTRKIQSFAAFRQSVLDEEWKHIDGVRTELERPIIAEMDAIFDDQRREAVEALAAFRSAEFETRDFFLTLDRIFNVGKWFERTWARIKRFVQAGIFGGYDAGAIQTGIDLPDLTSFDPSVRRYLETVSVKTKSITQTTAADMAALIDEALRGGWSIDKTADEISAKFDEYKGYRSKLIAQTNITGAFGKGQNEAFLRAGLRKRWLSQRDGRVRPTHTAADGQEVQANEKFKVGTANLNFPGDPESNDLSEIMGCRCSMLPVA